MQHPSKHPIGIARAAVVAAALLVPASVAAQASGPPMETVTKTPSTATARQTARANLETVTAEDVASWGVMPADMSWIAAPDMPGVQVAYLLSTPGSPYVVRMKLPDRYAVRAHKHGSRLLVTVLEGTYRLGFGKQVDEANTVAFPAGSYVMIPANVPHYAWTEGQTILQIVSNAEVKFEPAQAMDAPGN